MHKLKQPSWVVLVLLDALAGVVIIYYRLFQHLSPNQRKEARMLFLRNIGFARVWGGSGVQGFFGRKPSEYWYHRPLGPFGLTFDGMTFVAKTTTLDANGGNLPLRKDRITPRELFPRCIAVNPRAGVALNAVALSGPGAEYLLNMGRWQERKESFCLSFMSTKKTAGERIREFTAFARLLRPHLRNFRAPIALQVNFSCPNVGVNHTSDDLIREARETFDTADEIPIPIIPKISALLPVHAAIAMTEHRNCDAICCSNTIPASSEVLQRYFGSSTSPLLRRNLPVPGPGGISGAYLLPIVTAWIREAKKHGIRKPVIGGGGILSERDALAMKEAGANAVSLASIAFLRPWRVQNTIDTALMAYSY